jgi:hypothetical protein
VIDLIEDAHCRRRSEPVASLAKKAHGERVHCIADIHGKWNSCASVHCRDPAPRLTTVFNVTVHEKSVVQHFEACSGRQSMLGAATQSACGCEAQCWAQTFSRSVDKIFNEPVKMTLWLPSRYAGCQRVGKHVAVPSQAFQEALRSHNIDCTSRSIRLLNVGRAGFGRWVDGA